MKKIFLMLVPVLLAASFAAAQEYKEIGQGDIIKTAKVFSGVAFLDDDDNKLITLNFATFHFERDAKEEDKDVSQNLKGANVYSSKIKMTVNGIEVAYIAKDVLEFKYTYEDDGNVKFLITTRYNKTFTVSTKELVEAGAIKEIKPRNMDDVIGATPRKTRGFSNED
ncbi:hypothetical protein AAIR98_001172 [Elusimicrobium simillimum]|uniref:hypothetical protein n=1 Tax=Elusimicrobium simillimum TaxID=3143438 RepID=UPI003C6F17D3